MSKQLNLFSARLENPVISEQTSKVNSKNTLPSIYKIEDLGQVFTPQNVVEHMLGLIKNSGEVLEPSCGDGAFSSRLKKCTSIEIDAEHAPPYALIGDFFAFALDNKFDTIIGNPPYVRFQDIPQSTKLLFESDLFDSRSNLYLYFIEKSIKHLNSHGEIIFITPREFLKSTSSTKLNKLIYDQGTITHVIDYGDSKIFSNAVPNCIAFRFEKDNFERKTYCADISVRDSEKLKKPVSNWVEKKFQYINGQLLFTSEDYPFSLDKIASVKVGAVSGCDEIYVSEEFGNLDFVFSGTLKTGKTRKMIWPYGLDRIPEFLMQNKDRLLNRRIKDFDEKNWWEWGRGMPISNEPRIYVNSKTRNSKPFFLNDCKNFDGSVLAVFPLNKNVNLTQLTEDLNSINWSDLGFDCDGRLQFAQRSLETCPLPSYFTKYL